MALLRNLFQALKRTSTSISNAFNILTKKSVSPETIEALENTLLAADMGIETVEEIIQVIEKNRWGDITKAVEQYLITKLSEVQPEEFRINTPTIQMVVGVNGTGKTTTAAKLAHFYQNQGLNVLLIGADTYRAAAVEQLKIWAQRLNVELICNEQSRQPSAMVYDGLTAARAQGVDVAIVDTAGRLHTYKNLMNELEKMYRVANQHFSDFTLQSLLTLDASLGQNSLLQAREFERHVALTGAILTKMDGTAKGGIVFPLVREMKLPTLFVGIGEHLEDLTPFNPVDYVHSLLGTNEGVGN
jgi:fused signal recognition particle receptor